MAAAARYYITSVPAGYNGNSDAGGRILQSGKLTSANSSSISTIITVPGAPDGQEMRLNIGPAYIDPAAKTGAGYAYLHLSEVDATPAPGGAEAAVESVPRLVLRPPAAAYGSPGDSGFSIAVRKGQKFAIQDTGFAV